MSNLIYNEKYNFDLSFNQQRIIAGGFWLASLAICAFYSTPNTIDIFVALWGATNMLGIPYSGFIAAIVLGIFVNFLEYAFLGLAIWKRNSWYLIGTMLMACISWYGSVRFNEKSAKEGFITNQQVVTWERKISVQQGLIDADSAQIAVYQKRIDETPFGDRTPQWVFQRQREFRESKKVNQERLQAMQDSLLSTRQRVGAIISPGDETTGQAGVESYVWAFLWEALLVVLAGLGFILYEPDPGELSKAQVKAYEIARKKIRFEKNERLIERLNTRAVARRYQRIGVEKKIQPLPCPTNKGLLEAKGKKTAPKNAGFEIPAASGVNSGVVDSAKKVSTQVSSEESELTPASVNFAAKLTVDTPELTGELTPDLTGMLTADLTPKNENVSDSDIFDESKNREQYIRNLLLFANNKRLAQADKIKFIVLKSFTDDPTLSNQDIAGLVAAAGFKITRQWVSRLLINSGLKKRKVG